MEENEHLHDQQATDLVNWSFHNRNEVDDSDALDKLITVKEQKIKLGILADPDAAAESINGEGNKGSSSLILAIHMFVSARVRGSGPPHVPSIFSQPSCA